MNDTLLQVSRLGVRFQTPRGTLHALDDVSLAVARSRTLAIVGESGSGKSVLSRSILRLLGPAATTSPEARILFDGRDLLRLDRTAMQAVRGRRIAMVFQDPMTALNPVRPIGVQLAEGMRQHLRLTRHEAEARAVALLAQVGIGSPERRLRQLPHELSGGMRQRVMIAMMMACEPKLLIADEPTTALDVTIQAQILKLMRDLRDEKGTAILLITHDLGVIAEMCDAVTVMYAGSVVETGSIGDVLSRPRMPYSIGLLHSIPTIDEGAERRDVLPIIPGQVPDPNLHFDGCRFHPRCPFADEMCITTPPLMNEVEPGHFAACHHTDSIGENVAEVQAAFDVFAAEYELEGVA